MQLNLNYKKYSFLIAAGILLLSACKKDEYALPTAADGLQNQAIKRTLGPNIVGQTIEFAYAMAIKPGQGKLVTCIAEASIAGAPGTFMDNRSFFTKSNGADSGVVVASTGVTNAATTTITYNKDTSAATMRYYYVIPEAARNQSVSIKFTATSSNGQTVTTNMGPYTIAKMDMVRNIAVTNGNMAYISIADTIVYNAANAAANAAKIDLVYLYRNLTTSTFGHALVSPGADTAYLPGITLPAGVNRITKEQKVFNMQDYNLARLQYGGIFVDDIDFQKLDLTGQPNYAINLKAEAGVWIETADGKYRAYIYINSVNANGSAVISMKRYAL